MEEDIKPEKIDLIEIIRKFKREGIENFVVIRKEKLENILKEYKELKEIANTPMGNIRIANKEDYIPKSKVREALDITATVLGDKYELDYQEIQDIIAETITKIREELLQKGDK